MSDDGDWHRSSVDHNNLPINHSFKPSVRPGVSAQCSGEATYDEEVKVESENQQTA
jgi:hypothetical protein